MAHVFGNRLQETTTTTGTGTLTLGGAVSLFRTFGSKLAVGDTTDYEISGTGFYETGLGTLLTGTTLERTAVYESSNADGFVNLPAGTKNVRGTISAPSRNAKTAGAWKSALDLADARVLAAHFATAASGATVRIGKAGDSTIPNDRPFDFAAKYYSLRNAVETEMSQNGGRLSDFIVGSATWSMVTYKALAPAPTLGAFCFLINDACQTDLIGAYGSAKHIAFAATARANYLTLVNGVRASFPNLPIIILQSNHLGTGSTSPQLGNSVQNVNDALDLTYRGDQFLTVPSLQSVMPPGVVVLDLDGSVFHAGTPATFGLLLNPDATHPQPPGGYNARALAVAQLVAAEFNPTKSATIEAAMAGAQATKLQAVLEGDDYKLAYTGKVTVNDSNGWNISVNGFTDQALGAAFGQSPGQAGPRGLVPGDLAIWSDGTVDLIQVPPTGQQGGDLRFDYFSRAGDWIGRLFGSGNPPKAVNSTFRIYRHKYANSPGARNMFRMRNGTPAEASQVPRYSYRFWLVEANNGSCVIQGIGGEYDATNRQTANGHTMTVTDQLFIGGITLDTGLTLTGATFAVESNNTIRITLAGTDFRGSGSLQGFIFSSS